MIGLSLLGALRIEGLDPRVARSLVAGEKRVALLVYLLLAGRGEFIRRDTLLALLWPDADEAHARGALRALVHQLRRSLGPRTILARADQALAVDLQHVRCDVLAFEAAAAAGDWEAATALYRGALLEGFGLAGAPAFEDWLAMERDRLRALVRDVAWGAAGRARDRGDHTGEAAALRSLLSQAPYDEPATRALMQVLDRGGDRAGALRVFEHFAGRLRTDLDATPSAETMTLAAALRTPVRAATPEPAALPLPMLPGAADVGIAIRAAGEGVRPVPTRTSWRHPGARFATAAVVVATAIPLIVAVGARVHALPPLDPRTIAVLRFDAADRDTTLDRLARAVPALLAARLNQDAGPRTADPGAVLRARAVRAPAETGTAPEDAVFVARQVGAARAILGVAAPAPAGIALHATLVDAATSRIRARASVAGPVGSLDDLLDDLTIQLLAREAEEPEERLPVLAQEPLPAVLRYLEGAELLRAGRYPHAVAAYAGALEVDSTFATAALAASVAAGAGGRQWRQRGLLMAWRHRDRLAPFDRALLTAKLGPRHPEPSAQVEQLAAWEALLPDGPGRQRDAEVFYNYGDQLFHYGALMGIPDAFDRARVAFERAAQLDRAAHSPIQHLAELAFIRRDTADLRRAVTQLLARHDADTARHLARWMQAAAMDEGRWPRGVPRDLDLAPLYNLPIQAGVAIQDAERVARRWRDEATTPTDAVEQLLRLSSLALLEGRPTLAGALLDSGIAFARTVPSLDAMADRLDRLAVRAVLYWDADSTSAAGPVTRLTARTGRPAPSDPDARSRWAADLCVLEEWRLWHGNAASVASAISRLRGRGYGADVCAAVLGAIAAVVRGAPDAAARVDSLDALARTVPPGWIEWFRHGNLVIARLYERQGRLPEALAAIRRRGVYYLPFNEYLSTYVREEGRLALAVGDTAGALRAWRYYLGLRRTPEMPLQAERDRIHARVVTLEEAHRPAVLASRR